MISSVVIRLKNQADPQGVLRRIQDRLEFEVGELIDERLLPVTIDCPDHKTMEESTRWLHTLAGVEFVDVIYVNWETEAPPEALKAVK